MASDRNGAAGRDGTDSPEPVKVSAQKARQADGNFTPLRVLVFGLGLAGLAFVVTYVLGY